MQQHAPRGVTREQHYGAPTTPYRLTASDLRAALRPADELPGADRWPGTSQPQRVEIICMQRRSAPFPGGRRRRPALHIYSINVRTSVWLCCCRRRGAERGGAARNSRRRVTLAGGPSSAGSAGSVVAGRTASRRAARPLHQRSQHADARTRSWEGKHDQSIEGL